MRYKKLDRIFGQTAVAALLLERGAEGSGNTARITAVAPDSFLGNSCARGSQDENESLPGWRGSAGVGEKASLAAGCRGARLQH